MFIVLDSNKIGNLNQREVLKKIIILIDISNDTLIYGLIGPCLLLHTADGPGLGPKWSWACPMRQGLHQFDFVPMLGWTKLFIL